MGNSRWAWCMAAMLCLGTSLSAAPGLVVRDHALGVEPVMVRPMQWRGEPALSVLGRTLREGRVTKALLFVMQMRQGEWRVAGRWSVPTNTLFIEPVRFSRLRSGWLALVGRQWRMAAPDGPGLRWSPLCQCPTIYARGGSPRPDRDRLVHDLDGDGRDEILLPYPTYLEAYRPTDAPHALEPLWRLHWRAEGKSPAGKKAPLRSMPRFYFMDIDGDGSKDWLVNGNSHLLVSRLPPFNPQRFTLSKVALEALSLNGKGGLPPSLQEAARALSGTTYPTAQAFLFALKQHGTLSNHQQWAPHLSKLLRAGRGRLPEATPYTAPYPGLGRFDPKKDRYYLLALEDMDGDRIVDVLHAKVTDYKSKTSRKNEIRWFPGRISKGRLQFAKALFSSQSDAGSIATVIQPRADGAPPQELLLANTSVSFTSLMRVLTTGRATLQIQILPWRQGGPPTAPRTTGSYVFHDLKKKGRRPMFLAVDLNGDGKRDYLINLKDRGLAVLLSSGGFPQLKTSPPEQPGLSLPSRQERTLVTDLDSDGREELIVWYREIYQGALGLAIRMIRLGEYNR